MNRYEDYLTKIILYETMPGIKNCIREVSTQEKMEGNYQGIDYLYRNIEFCL
uniref:Uncharacterized protein n=1 Tax=Arion vulgaris TaxID=1028688 RepID=A0A0B6ZS92_9EUPU